MYQNEKLALIKALEHYPVITVKTVSDITGKDRRYAKLVVHRLWKEGLLRRIRRNIYTMQVDPMIVASTIVWPSYISGWSALRFHNLTEQLPSLINVVTTRRMKKRTFLFDGTRIALTRTKPSNFFGYRRESQGGFQVFIAEAEKALLDSALFRMMSFSEVCAVLREHRDSLDLGVLVRHLLRTGNKTLAKRFGYLIESISMDASSLEKRIDSRYVPLDYALPSGGKRDKRWKVMVNVER